MTNGFTLHAYRSYVLSYITDTTLRSITYAYLLPLTCFLIDLLYSVTQDFVTTVIERMLPGDLTALGQYIGDF